MMVRVKPFKAYRYNETKAGDLSRLVTPPYDIIKGDKRARDHFNKWVSEGILTPDEKESFYVYGQDFEIEGKKLFRFGFIGLIELEEFATSAPSTGGFSGVLQHEETLPKDIEDRLSLCRSSMANFGQIFVIYPDHKRHVDAILEKHMDGNPVGDIVDDAGIRLEN
jgi:uncharacterized protein (DUF1015 family)